MLGQKQYSLKDKLAGKTREDVRTPEDAKVVKQRQANMGASKKKKKVAAPRRRAAKKSIKNNEEKK